VPRAFTKCFVWTRVHAEERRIINVSVRLTVSVRLLTVSVGLTSPDLQFYPQPVTWVGPWLGVGQVRDGRSAAYRPAPGRLTADRDVRELTSGTTAREVDLHVNGVGLAVSSGDVAANLSG